RSSSTPTRRTGFMQTIGRATVRGPRRTAGNACSNGSRAGAWRRSELRNRKEPDVADVHFGVTLPQIKRPWEETKAAAIELDRLGFRSLWFNDHLYGVPMPQLPILEAWTALAAVGALTTKVELGTLVTPVGFRNPALLAKMAATLDVITGGRVIVGLGSGWFQSEFAGYGMPFPPLKDRLEQLDETATILKLLWTEPQPSFAGRHYRLEST